MTDLKSEWKPELQPELKIDQLTVAYQEVTALKSLSFELMAGEIVAVIGANGAGKTSTLRAISGLIKPKSGKIFFQGEEISKLSAHLLVRKGISHVPEGRGIFLNLTVAENLDLGVFSGKIRSRAQLATELEEVFALFPRLKERRKQNAGTLSGGEQQMLAIGRALLAHPKLLLLDEPSLGLAPQMIEKIFEIILDIHRKGTTIFLVEQNALQALKIAHRGLVLETGTLVAQGPAKDLLQSDAIRQAYLGG